MPRGLGGGLMGGRAGVHTGSVSRGLERLLAARSKYLGVFILFILAVPLIAGVPRAYFKTGTATTTNATVTFTFNPTSFCIANDEASGAADLWTDFTDGVAVATDNSTNIKVKAASSICFSNADKNPNTVFTVGVITSSSTAVYRVYGYRNQ